MVFVEVHSSSELLTKFALCQVLQCPFGSADIEALKPKFVGDLELAGLKLCRAEDDRVDLPMIFRFLTLLLQAP